MAYGKKYNYYFAYGVGTTQYELAIYEDGYASTVTALIPGDNPFTHSILGQEGDEDEVIFGSQGMFNFIVDDADKTTYDNDFLSIEYKEKIVKLILDPQGSPETKWIGILLPENSYREYQQYKYTYTIAANDGLADLRDVFYTQSGQDNGTVYRGFEDMLTIIKTAISKVADISDLQLPFRIQLGTYSDQMSSTENAFKENEIVQELTFEEGSGDRKTQTCRTVLEKILKPFNCNMIQWDGYYWIFNYAEITSYYFEYDWSTLTQQSRTAFSRVYAPASFSNHESPGTLYKRPALFTLNSILNNREYLAQLITNTGFLTDVSNWTNGDADDSSNTWTAFSWYDHPTVNGAARLTWGGSATAGDYSIHSNSFTLETGAGAGNVTVTVLMEWNSVSSGGGTNPNLELTLWNATDGYVTGTVGAQTFLTVGGFVIYTETFATTGLGATTNYLNLEVHVVDATTTGIQFYIDYVTLTQVSDYYSPSDWEERAVYQVGSSKSIKENNIYIGDQKESSNDICAIRDSGGTYTSTWTRYGKTEDIILSQAYRQNYMNSSYFYANFITVSYYDPDEYIEPHLLINDTDESKYYRIIGYEKKYRDATLNLQMRQMYQNDVTLAFVSTKLSTAYGQNG